MNTLKYLKLFESFESEALRKGLKFIKKNIGEGNSNKFLKTLKILLNNTYDIPLSEISNIEYMPAIIALKIKPKGEIINPYGIYALKFWFSLTKGYIGVTAVGKSFGAFSQKEIKHLSEKGINNGILIPVVNYRDLKHGDEVIGVFDSDSDSLSCLAPAKIFIELNSMWAIQDVSDGGSSKDKSWRNWGSKSWYLGENGNAEPDHHKLHKYIHSDDPLYVKQDGESFLDIDGNITSLSRQWINPSDLKDVDFAFVIYFDEILNDEGVRDIKKWRREEKKGATALLSNEEIKKLNFERYFNKMIEKWGLTLESEESDIKNLQKMVKNIVAGEFVFMSFYSDDPSLSAIEDIAGNIVKLINSSDKSRYLNLISDGYITARQNSDHYKSKYAASLERVKKSGDEKTLEFFNKAMEISKLIYKKIEDSKVESIADLIVLKRKLQSTREMFLELKNKYFCRGIIIALQNFKYDDSDVDNGLELASSKPNLDEDLKGLEIFEKFIIQVFS